MIEIWSRPLPKNRRITIAWISIAGLMACMPTVGAFQSDPPLTILEEKVARELCGQSASAAQIRALSVNGFFLRDEEFCQIFSAYVQSAGSKALDRDAPPFVTVDSLLNIYHILTEKTLAVANLQRALAIRKVLEVWPNRILELKAPSAINAREFADAKSKAIVVCESAASLMGLPPKVKDREILMQIRAIVDAAQAGVGSSMPHGFEANDLLAIDWSAFRTTPLYSDLTISGYLNRTVRWFQSLPFRTNDDSAMLVLAILARSFPSELPEAKRFFADDQGSILGTCRYVTLSSVIRELASNSKSEDWLNVAALRLLIEKLNSQLTIPKKMRGSESDSVPIHCRILSPTWTPDLWILRECANARNFPSQIQMKFNGLDLPRWLGLTGVEAKAEDDEFQRAFARVPVQPKQATLFESYLETLQVLMTEQDSRQPAFMRTKAWKQKKASSMLASWVQQRYLSELQVNDPIDWQSETVGLPGFVEPQPVFFAKFAQHVKAVAKSMESVTSAADLEQYQRFVLAAETRELIKGFANTGIDYRVKTEKRDMEFFVWGTTYHYSKEIPPLKRIVNAIHYCGKRIQSKSQVGEPLDLPAALEKLARHFESGPMDSFSKAVVRERFGPHEGTDLQQHWRRVESYAKQFAQISEKQLAGQDLDERDRATIEYYGESIANIMGYFGPQMAGPNNDAPRITVLERGISNQPYHHFATGRPLAIYVAVPWKGKHVLCRGAVLPYYEFDSPTKVPLTNWIKRNPKDVQQFRPSWSPKPE